VPREVVTVHVSEIALHLNNSSSLRKLVGDLIDDLVVDPRIPIGRLGPLKHLITPLEDGRIVWNAKHYRTLVLLTFWLGFEYVADHVYASTMQYWKSRDNMLFEWLQIVHLVA
jgi:hypothetical protein